jgi:flagellar biosynthetic protein FliO
MNYFAELIPPALKMLSALAVVLAGLLAIIFFTKRMIANSVGGSGDKLISVLASTYIGVKKSISLVRVPGALLVLGISNDNIRLLAKIDDQKLLDKFKEVENHKPTVPFTEQLHKFSLRLRAGRHTK